MSRTIRQFEERQNINPLPKLGRPRKTFQNDPLKFPRQIKTEIRQLVSSYHLTSLVKQSGLGLQKKKK